MDIKSFLFLVVAILSVGLFAYLFKEKNEDAVFKQIRLFPRRFKFLGLFVILCSVILPWIFEGLLVDGSNYIGATYLNLGLSLICFSRDKTEDEMLNIIRLKSFYRSME
jgi:drug/metabolite transporter superfamily protein YnfA